MYACNAFAFLSVSRGGARASFASDQTARAMEDTASRGGASRLVPGEFAGPSASAHWRSDSDSESDASSDEGAVARRPSARAASTTTPSSRRRLTMRTRSGSERRGGGGRATPS